MRNKSDRTEAMESLMWGLVAAAIAAVCIAVSAYAAPSGNLICLFAPPKGE